MLSDSKWIKHWVERKNLKTTEDELEMAQYIACGWYEPYDDELYRLTYAGEKGLKEIVDKNEKRRK